MEKFIQQVKAERMGNFRVNAKELVELIKKGEGVMVDVRENYETAVWGFNFGYKIPVSELPSRLEELPKDKIIITACPHKDRSNIACTFLRVKGFNAKYLSDGLVGLAEELRGSKVLDFSERILEGRVEKENNPNQ